MKSHYIAIYSALLFMMCVYVISLAYSREVFKLEATSAHQMEMHHTYRQLYLDTKKELLQCKTAFNSLKTSMASLSFREELYAENVKLNMRIVELSNECGL
ncbi:MAG: hypothetical protein ACXAEN_17040 [Candidatus Thorarchaeota archaeon]